MNPSSETLVDLIIQEYQSLVEAGMLEESDRPLSAETSLDLATGAISSLNLIQFVVQVEKALEENLQIRIDLSSGEVLAANPNPFQNIGSLAAYIQRQQQS
jgi:acyl carrier protein